MSTSLQTPFSTIAYATEIQVALRSVVKSVLFKVAEHGYLPGEHYFGITFNTSAKGVLIPDFLLKKYPGWMTIVIQHQWSDLKVFDFYFSIGLYFNGVKEILTIPFDSIVYFGDPSANIEFILSAAKQVIASSDKAASSEPTDSVTSSTSDSISSTPTTTGNVISVPFGVKRKIKS